MGCTPSKCVLSSVLVFVYLIIRSSKPMLYSYKVFIFIFPLHFLTQSDVCHPHLLMVMLHWFIPLHFPIFLCLSLPALSTHQCVHKCCHTHANIHVGAHCQIAWLAMRLLHAWDCYEYVYPTAQQPHSNCSTGAQGYECILCILWFYPTSLFNSSNNNNNLIIIILLLLLLLLALRRIE